MELKGKKIVVLGDSITEGCGTSGADKHFVTLLQQMGACREVKNYGIGGTRIARQIHRGADEPLTDYCARVEDLDADADIVLVFGGTNDYGHGDAPLGTFEERTPCTFYGACHYLMNRLYERFPGRPIILLTPLHRLDENNLRGDGSKPFCVAPLKKYVDIIREVAEYYALPVLDLYAESGIQPEVPVIRERFCPDGLHPNDDGHVLLANKIYAYLRAF